jgi:hypothetical protein
LDSRGVDLTMAYHAFFASRCLLEVIIFQGPYQGFVRFRRPCEHETLASNKSHCYCGLLRFQPPQGRTCIAQGNLISLWVGGTFATSHCRLTS